MNVKTNVQAGQDLRFPAIDETSGTVQAVDLVEARRRCNRAPGPENVSCHCLSACDLLPQCLDEIERLRIELALYIRAFRIRANYKPEGK